MDQFTEESLADHVENRHLLSHVIHVFHHDAILSSLLRRLDELPALFQRDRGGYLGGGVLAVPYGSEADRGVPLPGRCGIDQVPILRLADPFEVSFTARVCRMLPKFLSEPWYRKGRLFRQTVPSVEPFAGR